MRLFRIGAGTLLAACVILVGVEPPIVTSLRNAVFDGYQRIFPRQRVSEPAVIVEIDERSLAALGQWPWPRTRLADLIDRISEHRPMAIGMDLLFPEPDRFSPAAMALLQPVMPTELAEKLRPMVPPGYTMAEFALRWILDHPAVSVIIPGARNAEQANANAEPSERAPLSGELHAELRKFFADEVKGNVRGPD